jgi:hypothetical protein
MPGIQSVCSIYPKSQLPIFCCKGKNNNNKQKKVAYLSQLWLGINMGWDKGVWIFSFILLYTCRVQFPSSYWVLSFFIFVPNPPLTLGFSFVDSESVTTSTGFLYPKILALFTCHIYYTFAFIYRGVNSNKCAYSICQI